MFYIRIDPAYDRGGSDYLPRGGAEGCEPSDGGGGRGDGALLRVIHMSRERKREVVSSSSIYAVNTHISNPISFYTFKDNETRLEIFRL